METPLSGCVPLRQHVDECRDACPDQVSGFKEEVKWLIEKLLQELGDQFKVDVKVRSRRPQIFGERLKNQSFSCFPAVFEKDDDEEVVEQR